MAHAKIVLPATAPFRLDLTAWALRRRSKNAVDRWDGSKYTRIIVSNNGPIKLTVTQETAGIEPTLGVVIESGARISDRVKREVELLVERVFGLGVDLHPFYVLAANSDSISALVKQFMGVKPPRFTSVFEGLINSIACQQVTLDLGIVLLNRLSDRFGTAFTDREATLRAFPAPVDLARVSEEAVKELGFSHQKARAIKALATNIAEDRIDLTGLEDLTNEEAVERLSTIRGVGRWSAEYVLLRGLGRLDTFPGDDVGAQNNLQRLFRLEDRPSYEEIRQLTSQWRPYGGVVYFHLLLEKLHMKGAM